MDTKERIFALLDEKKLPQKALAESIGVSEGMVTDWRLGRSKSFNRYLVQIAQALGTTSEYLLTGENNSPPALADELYESFRDLTPEEQADTLAYVAFLKSRRHKP